jgi:anti-sigma regulatory factor (Ser/Thr protein kinase)
MDRVTPYELPLRACADSVGVARRYFASIARERALPAALRDAGSLIVSELVTNAVVHGSDPITLRVTPMPRTLRLAVSDGCDRPPTPRLRSSEHPIAADPESADHGRGLAIVDGLADQWGCEPSVQTPGKTIWCHLSISPDDAS